MQFNEEDLLRAEHASAYFHPRTGVPLELEAAVSSGDDVRGGSLVGDGDRFPIADGIPRFCLHENYASSFGYQWNVFARVQLDSERRWNNQSRHRLYDETGWPARMVGQRILEAGSGMGRFTEILAETGASVFTFDYSSAVVANYANNRHFANVSFAQADIYEPPYEKASFDRVLCIGVLQACPRPRDAFLSLVRFLKPGGEIVIDVYHLSWRSLFFGKYYLRPFTRLLGAERLHRFVRFHVGWVYPFTGWLQRRIGRFGRSVSWGLAMADYRGLYDMDDATARELSELDTFDMLAPAYDRPQTLSEVRRWFRLAGLQDVDVRPGWNGIQGRGVRPPGV